MDLLIQEISDFEEEIRGDGALQSYIIEEEPEASHTPYQPLSPTGHLYPGSDSDPTIKTPSYHELGSDSLNNLTVSQPAKPVSKLPSSSSSSSIHTLVKKEGNPIQQNTKEENKEDPNGQLNGDDFSTFALPQPRLFVENLESLSAGDGERHKESEDQIRNLQESSFFSTPNYERAMLGLAPFIFGLLDFDNILDQGVEAFKNLFS